MKTLFRETLSQTPTGRVAEIVVSWHRVWEEVVTERGNGKKDFTEMAKNGVFFIYKIKDGSFRT